jgi:hypothetical protein
MARGNKVALSFQEPPHARRDRRATARWLFPFLGKPAAKKSEDRDSLKERGPRGKGTPDGATVD